MKALKFSLLNNWSMIRLIRLVLSIIIIVQAVQVHNVLFGLFGTFFLYQALSNTGCCGMSGCTPDTYHKTITEEVKETEIEIVEIKNNQDNGNNQ